MDNGASSYRRFLDGDNNGLTEIVRDYKDGLILYINSFVGNIYVAEELMEDTFFKLITKKPKFSEKYSFKTWLYTIGRNVAIDYLRKNSKNLEVPLEDVEGFLQEEYDLESLYIKKEQGIELRRVMKKINPEYAQVLWLIYFEGFTSAEASVIIKKNPKQIKNLLYRAKEALKTQLDKEGFIYEEL
jgi:RNA polymerase sigma-70 factor (ECF subfamily)